MSTLTPEEQAFFNQYAGPFANLYAPWLPIVVIAGTLAVVILFWTVVYLNRKSLKRLLRNWLND